MSVYEMSEQDPWSNPSARKKTSDSKEDITPETEEKKTEEDDLPGWARSGKPPARGGSILTELLELFETAKGDNTKKKGGKKPFGFFNLLYGVLGAALLIWGAMGFYVVDEQERGVVLRFGKYTATLSPGLRWQPFLIDKVIVVNVTRVRSFSARGIMLTKNENIVDITLEVQYDINDARDFAINVRDPEMSIRQATDSALRHVVGSTNLDRVITEGRAQVATDVQARVQTYIDNYGTGIRVVQVNIQKADPPQEVKPAFEDAISAREDEVRFRNQAEAYAKTIIPQARGEAQRILEDGRAYKERTVARSEGDAQRFTLVYQAYRAAPAVTRRRLYLEAMEEVLANSDKVLVDVSKGNNVLYLPLDKIARRSSEIGETGAVNSGGAELTERQLSRIIDGVINKIDVNTLKRNGR